MDRRDAVVDAGGAAAAVRALRKHGDAPEVRQWGLYPYPYPDPDP